MVEFDEQDLRGSRFSDVRLSGALFERVHLDGARFHNVDLTGAELRDVDLVDVTITGDVRGLTINEVDVGSLVDAELDRRHPGRAAMRPTDAAGFRAAWELLERLWDETVERARRVDPELLHESVDGEWSFVETLRHLLFATDSWVRRALLGEPSPWHRLDLPWDQMPDIAGVPRDRAARPSLDEVLALRRDRAATVREVLAGLTDEALDGHTTPVDGPGWPEGSFPVRGCLRCVLNEEWEHRRYAERDLAVLAGRGQPA